MITKQQFLEYKKTYCSSVIRRTLQLKLICKSFRFIYILLQQVALHLGAMKGVIQWAFLLGTVRCGDYSDLLQCAADPTNIKFSFKSYHNQTGYWTAQVSKHIYNLA